MQIVTIIGCRNDQQVTQIRKYDKFGCVTSTEYTDGIIGDAGWTEGTCGSYDYEKLVMCDLNKTKVLVESWTDIKDPLQAPTVRYTIFGTTTLWTGDPATELSECEITLDPEAVCLVPNGSPTNTIPVSGVVVYDISMDPPTSKYYIGNVDVTATHTQVPCDTSMDNEMRESCYQEIALPAHKYERIDWFAKEDLANPISTVWFDTATGLYDVTTPLGIQPCGDAFVVRTLLGTESFSIDTVTGFPNIPAGTGHVEFQVKGGKAYVRTGSAPTALESITIDEGKFNEIGDSIEILGKQFLGELPGTTVYAEYWNIPDSVF